MIICVIKYLNVTVAERRAEYWISYEYLFSSIISYHQCLSTVEYVCLDIRRSLMNLEQHMYIPYVHRNTLGVMVL